MKSSHFDVETVSCKELDEFRTALASSVKIQWSQ